MEDLKEIRSIHFRKSDLAVSFSKDPVPFISDNWLIFDGDKRIILKHPCYLDFLIIKITEITGISFFLIQDNKYSRQYTRADCLSIIRFQISLN